MTRRLLATLFIAVLALACAAFIVLNPEPLVLELAFARFDLPTGQALTLLFLAGWAMGLLTASFWIGGLVADRSRLKRSLSLAESEVRTLKAIATYDGR